MESLIGEWAGKVVSVALRLGGGFTAAGAAILEGKLVQVGEAGVMLELSKKGRTFVPISAMLHISLLEGQ
jgi:hypothetical protein